MIRSRGLRGAIAIAASAAAITAAAPGAAVAAPLSPTGQLDPALKSQLQDLAAQTWMPAKGGQLITALVNFFTYSDGDGGIDLPPADGPRIAQGAWPTVADHCIDGKNISVGTALAVPGPANLPQPGTPARQTSFVFTGLGTGKVVNSNMNVQWVNVNNGRTGTTPLRFTGINADGPATLNGTADTGSGRVLAVVNGGFTATNKSSGPAYCGYLPTIIDVTVA